LVTVLPVGTPGKVNKVRLLQRVLGIAEVKLEHGCPCCNVRQRNVDSLFKTAWGRGEEREEMGGMGRSGRRQVEKRPCPNFCRGEAAKYKSTTYRRRMAESSDQGVFVAPSTRTCLSSSFPTPCI